MGTAAVSGSASGIGAAVRSRLARQGDRVIGIDVREKALRQRDAAESIAVPPPPVEQHRRQHQPFQPRRDLNPHRDRHPRLLASHVSPRNSVSIINNRSSFINPKVPPYYARNCVVCAKIAAILRVLIRASPFTSGNKKNLACHRDLLWGGRAVFAKSRPPERLCRVCERPNPACVLRGRGPAGTLPAFRTVLN